MPIDLGFSAGTDMVLSVIGEGNVHVNGYMAKNDEYKKRRHFVFNINIIIHSFSVIISPKNLNQLKLSLKPNPSARHQALWRKKNTEGNFKESNRSFYIFLINIVYYPLKFSAKKVDQVESSNDGESGDSDEYESLNFDHLSARRPIRYEHNLSSPYYGSPGSNESMMNPYRTMMNPKKQNKKSHSPFSELGQLQYMPSNLPTFQRFPNEALQIRNSSSIASGFQMRPSQFRLGEEFNFNHLPGSMINQNAVVTHPTQSESPPKKSKRNNRSRRKLLKSSD